jgi:tRNA1Val (adenine37-N6)-methyltransferase
LIISEMPNDWFQFREFLVRQDRTAMKVGTDGVLLGAWAGSDSARQVLDIGTGTGLVAIMLAQRNPLAAITAIEIDHDSAGQAAENAARSRWASRIEVVEADFRTWTPDPEVHFDLIVCNPPYFSRSLKNPDDQKADARHDHRLPLEQLIERAGGFLAGNGVLALILPFARVGEAMAKAANCGLFLNREMRIRGHAGVPVKRVLLEWSRLQAEVRSGEMILETDARGKFSDEYRELTDQFYLPR